MQRKSFTSLFWVLAFGLVFAAGLAVRLVDLADPPLDFHPTRQLHSALIARGMYYANNGDVPAWQREMAVQQQRMEGIIEPQVMESLAAWSYTLAGAPDLRLPRLFAIAFWLAAAVFLVLIVIDLAGRPAAMAAAVFFLSWNYGVIASRAFQPETLMIALIAASLWAALRWEQSPSWRWTVLAGLLAGLALFVKTVAAFFLLPALAVLVLARLGWKAARSPQVWVMVLLGLLPVALYYLDGLLLRGYLVSQFGARFFPELWFDPAFYLRWLRNLSRLLPIGVILASLAGVFLLPRAAHRAALLALWAGYAVLGLTLPHHISTHDYYHLPLALPIAIGLGAAGQMLYQNLRGPRRFAQIAVLGLLLVALAYNVYDARAALKRFDGAAQAQVWTAIGERLGPEASVVALVPDYGSGLKYYAWINPLLWSDRASLLQVGGADPFQAAFDAQAAGRHYFVITELDEFARQPELQDMLYDHYALIAEMPEYLIFNLQAPPATE